MRSIVADLVFWFGIDLIFEALMLFGQRQFPAGGVLVVDGYRVSIGQTAGYFSFGKF